MKQNISYKKRKLADLMRQGLNAAPVIVLSGARQVGKSTRLLNEPPFKKSTWAI
jgi:predicted AAA+ superfamily ATPase